MSGKNRGCKSCSDKRSDDCDTCNDKKKLIPVYGPPGPPGPLGPSVGTIIPYGSGSKIEISNKFGEINLSLTLGFGNNHVFSSVNEALSNSEDIFITPRNGKIKSLFAGIQLDFKFNLIITLETLCEVRKSINGSPFEQFSPPVIATVDVGDINPMGYIPLSGEFDPPIEVSKNTSLILVIQLIATVIETPGINKLGFRGGLNIE